VRIAARYRAILEPDSPAGVAADDYFRNTSHATRRCCEPPSPDDLQRRYRVNVIPSEAKATLDVRGPPDEDPVRFLEAVRKVINDPAIAAPIPARTNRPAGVAARLDSEAFSAVQSAVARDYDTLTIPMMGTGATTWRRSDRRAPSAMASPAADFESTLKDLPPTATRRSVENELHRFVRFSWMSW